MAKIETLRNAKIDQFLNCFKLKNLHNKFYQTDKKVMEKFQTALRLSGTETNIWVEIGKLVSECQALNLGQGFPDFYPPKFVTEALQKVSNEEKNFLLHQYTRSYGHPRLVNAVARTFSRELKRNIDPLTEVLISVGAYGALFFANQGLINPGDEVIIIEPFFDSYEPMVRQAGGIPRFISLKSTKPKGTASTTADWTFDRKELEGLFSSNTKLIIFNNPNNPLGKVYTRDEMSFVADLCKKHNVVVISDEVYDRLIYPQTTFIRMANIAGMYCRTVTIGSSGKTFSVTGWKLGWSVGPPHLIKSLCYVHQNCNYTCATPLQEAVAMCFEREEEVCGTEESYFYQAPREILAKREKMSEMLLKIGVVPIIPEAGYFMLADISNTGFQADENKSQTKDYQFVEWMCRTKKLSAIPNSAFYNQENKHLSADLVRFCFFKKDSTLERAAEIFENWKN